MIMVARSIRRGRPAQLADGVSFLVLVEREDNDRLLAVKNDTGKSRSEIIREAIAEYLDRYAEDA